MLAISLASFSQTASVTFNLNMELEEVSDGGVYLAGGADFGAPGDNPMTDEDGDGVYSVTIEVNTPYTGNYTFTNGNCPDWSCKEHCGSRLRGWYLERPSSVEHHGGYSHQHVLCAVHNGRFLLCSRKCLRRHVQCQHVK